MNSRQGLILRYGCAVLSVALAAWCRLRLDALMGAQLPFFTIFLAVLLTAWYGGLWPALVAVTLGAVASDFLLLRPRGTLTLDFDTGIALAAFITTSLGIALLGGLMHGARRRAESAAESAREQAAALEMAETALRAANESLEARVQARTADLDEANQSLQASEERYRLLIDGVQDSEAKFRSYIENAPVAVIMRDGVVSQFEKSKKVPSVPRCRSQSLPS
jgi:K+-sensing histidine kinase KdpD